MRVISYALFRAANSQRTPGFFAARMPVALRAARALFPDFELRIHHDSTVLDTCAYGPVLKRLAARGVVKLVDCGPATRYAEAMLWRLKPVWDAGVEYVLSRDLDSVASPRERWAFEWFKQSGMPMHLINDARAHQPTGKPFMLGGMVGFWAPSFRGTTGIESWAEFLRMAGEHMHVNLDGYGGDQTAMMEVFHPLLGGKFLQHTGSGGCAPIETAPWKVPVDPAVMRDAGRWTEYIGMVIREAAIKDACAWYDQFPSSAPIIEAERS